MVAFVFLGPCAWICQDAFPARRLRGLLLRGNLGSLLRQLNPLTLCFLIKITLWLIRQKEGPSPSLALPPPPPPPPPPLLSPPAQFPGRFDYNLWRTFLTAKLLKMCWQMRWTGQLVKPRGCRQQGRVGESDRGRDWMKKEQKEQTEKEYGKERVCKEWACKWQEKQIKRKKRGLIRRDLISSRSSRDSDKQADRQSSWMIVLIWREHVHSQSRGEDSEKRSRESAIRGGCVQETILNSSWYSRSFETQVQWYRMWPGALFVFVCLLRLKLSCYKYVETYQQKTKPVKSMSVTEHNRHLMTKDKTQTLHCTSAWFHVAWVMLHDWSVPSFSFVRQLRNPQF